MNLRPGRQDNLSTGVLPGNLAWKLFYEFLVISLLLAEISLLAEGNAAAKLFRTRQACAARMVYLADDRSREWMTWT